MPSMTGGDQRDKDYAPHMWLGNHYIHNTEQVIQVGDWWYRGGRLLDETIVAERWKGGQYRYHHQTDHEMVPLEAIPTELQEAMKSVSRARQEAFQRGAEQQHHRRPR